MPNFVSDFTKHSSFRYLINEADDDGMNALWVEVSKVMDESKIGSHRHASIVSRPEHRLDHTDVTVGVERLEHVGHQELDLQAV
jgi:hypothetical protein